MMRTIVWINKGHYFTGDGALRDEDGDYRITGRVDDVVNIKGHRMGTAEIEDAMVSGSCHVRLLCGLGRFLQMPVELNLLAIC